MNISPEIISLIDGIMNDRTHGASQLARQAVKVLKIAAERSQVDSVEQFLQEQKEVGQRLMSAHPAMAPVFNIVSSLLSTIAGKTTEVGLDSIRRLTNSRIDEVIAEFITGAKGSRKRQEKDLDQILRRLR